MLPRLDLPLTAKTRRGEEGKGATHPVLGRLPDERILTSSSSRVSSDGVTSRSHKIVEFRELDDDGIVVVGMAVKEEGGARRREVSEAREKRRNDSNARRRGSSETP